MPFPGAFWEKWQLVLDRISPITRIYLTWWWMIFKRYGLVGERMLCLDLVCKKWFLTVKRYNLPSYNHLNDTNGNNFRLKYHLCKNGDMIDCFFIASGVKCSFLVSIALLAWLAWQIFLEPSLMSFLFLFNCWRSAHSPDGSIEW